MESAAAEPSHKEEEQVNLDVLFFNPKYTLHEHPADTGHYQTCDSLAASEDDPDVLFFIHKSNLYEYNTRTRMARPAVQDCRSGTLYSICVKYGFLVACGMNTLIVKRLKDDTVLCPSAKHPPRSAIMQDMNNGVDINYHGGELRLFLARNSGILSVINLPEMEVVATMKLPAAVNYVSCSHDNQRFLAVGDKDYVNVYTIDHYVADLKAQERRQKQQQEQAEKEKLAAEKQEQANRENLQHLTDGDTRPTGGGEEQQAHAAETTQTVESAQQEEGAQNNREEDEDYEEDVDGEEDYLYEEDEQEDSMEEDEEDLSEEELEVVAQGEGEEVALNEEQRRDFLQWIGQQLGGQVEDFFRRHGDIMISLVNRPRRGAARDEDEDEEEESEEDEDYRRAQEFGTEAYSLCRTFGMNEAQPQDDSLPSRRLRWSIADDCPQYAAWSAESEMYAVSSECKLVAWWDAFTGQELGRIKTEKPAYAIRYSRAGPTTDLLAFVERKRLHIVNPHKPKAEHQIIELKVGSSDRDDDGNINGEKSHEPRFTYATGLAFSCDGTKLFVGTKHGIMEFRSFGVKSLLNLCVERIQRKLEEEQRMQAEGRAPSATTVFSESAWEGLPWELMERIFPSSSKITFLSDGGNSQAPTSS
ncbi:hypothetical protein QOT17_020164 [Balamuthia mandrillaris]